MEENRIFIYNAQYPPEFDEPHAIFKKIQYRNEYDTSNNAPGLPGVCYPPFPSLFVLPCILPNDIVPIRKCSQIGAYGTGWPRFHFTDGTPTPLISISTLLTMYGTSFVSCAIDNDDVETAKKIGKRAPILPNMRVQRGYDAVSNTACLKLNAKRGLVEPVWLGRKDRGETVEVYLERLPAIPF
jgi:hypothetical protein